MIFLSYLPDTVDTVKGQNILTDEFGVGSYSIVIIDNKMKDKRYSKKWRIK